MSNEITSKTMKKKKSLENKKEVKKNNNTGIKSFLKGFGHAFDGIFSSIKSERNLRFHIVAMVYVYIFSVFYNFTKIEYIVLTITCGLVIFSELINTAIEAICDRVSKEYHDYIKLAKDAGAGAVLVLAIMAVVVGVFLFFDIEIIKEIFFYFMGNPVLLLILVLSIPLAVLFINGKKSWREG